MRKANKYLWQLIAGTMISVFIFLVAGCSAGAVAVGRTVVADIPSAQAEMLRLPELEAIELDGTSLKVVATTSIIGDVVAQVGGDAIQLTTLMGPGQDPHSFEPSARELTAVADADLIIVNGWDLEEALVYDLAEIGKNVPLVAISANIEPLAFGAVEHSGADPHVWFSIDNVEQWVENVEQLLSDLDPANAAAYKSNAEIYLAELAELKAYVAAALAVIPDENRLLVTNHAALSYFADAYGFELIGTVIPSASTLAEPSASDLAVLIAAMKAQRICTIFTETAVSDSLAQTVAGELNDCEEVKVLPLNTGSLGVAGSGADSYIGMFRANIAAIVSGLQSPSTSEAWNLYQAPDLDFTIAYPEDWNVHENMGKSLEISRNQQPSWSSQYEADFRWPLIQVLHNLNRQMADNSMAEIATMLQLYDGQLTAIEPAAALTARPTAVMGIYQIEAAEEPSLLFVGALENEGVSASVQSVIGMSALADMAELDTFRPIFEQMLASIQTGA